MKSAALFCAALAAPVLAAEPNSSLQANDALSWSASLVLVIATILVCAWLLKKTRFTQFGSSQLKIVSSLALGTRERILVVEVGSVQYLIGVTGQQINLLDKLDEPLTSPSKPAPGHFASQLTRVLKSHED